MTILRIYKRTCWGYSPNPKRVAFSKLGLFDGYQTIKICQETGEPHLYHHAHEHEGKLYYRGKLVSSNAPK